MYHDQSSPTTVEHNSSTYTSAEMRARSILSRIDSISAKLKTLEADIRLLWVDFENLQPGETILGCRTKKEFCEKKLHRTPRAIQYLLSGGNSDRSEIISLPPSEISPVKPEPVESPDPSREPKPERTLEYELDKLVERIALSPYGYYAAKFKIYPGQHTADLAAIEITKEEIWKQIVEIGQANLALRSATSGARI